MRHARSTLGTSQINSYENFDLLSSNITFLKESKSLKALIKSKLINYKHILAENISTKIFSFYDLLNVLEGKLLFSDIPNFVIASAYTKFFHSKFAVNLFVIDSANQAYTLSNLKAPLFVSSNRNYLNLDADVTILGNNFVLSSELKNKDLSKMLIGVSSNFLTTNSFANLFGNPILSSAINPLVFTSTHFFYLLNKQLST